MHKAERATGTRSGPPATSVTACMVAHTTTITTKNHRYRPPRAPVAPAAPSRRMVTRAMGSPIGRLSVMWLAVHRYAPNAPMPPATEWPVAKPSVSGAATRQAVSAFEPTRDQGTFPISR